MSDAHPDDFGGTDDGSHLVPKALPHLDHVGPVQSGTLRTFTGVDLGTGPDATIVRLASGRTIDVSSVVSDLAAEYQADHPMIMTQVGALTRWLNNATAFDDAVMLGQAAGLDIEHAQRLATIAGFRQVTRVRFEAKSDEDASRIAAVLGALGYATVRIVETAEHRDRWALSELERHCTLSPSEHDIAAAKLGLRAHDGRMNRYVEERLVSKLGGKTLDQAVAEIAEVRP